MLLESSRRRRSVPPIREAKSTARTGTDSPARRHRDLAGQIPPQNPRPDPTEHRRRLVLRRSPDHPMRRRTRNSPSHVPTNSRDPAQLPLVAARCPKRTRRHHMRAIPRDPLKLPPILKPLLPLELIRRRGPHTLPNQKPSQAASLSEIAKSSLRRAARNRYRHASSLIPNVNEPLRRPNPWYCFANHTRNSNSDNVARASDKSARSRTFES